jgi:hypothetical protein
MNPAAPMKRNVPPLPNLTLYKPRLMKIPETARIAVQCSHPDTGEVGSFLYKGGDPKSPGCVVSPVFASLTLLFPWAKANGFEECKPARLYIIPQG